MPAIVVLAGAGGASGTQLAVGLPGPADLGLAPAVRGPAVQVGPTLQLPTTPIYYYRGRTDARTVALTFDAGSDRGYAAEILDLLKTRGLHVTFGITGHWAVENPDLTKRMVDEGHSFINHTYHHDSLTGFATHKPPQSADTIRAELDDTEAAVHRITGGTTKPWFRPPYGDMDARTIGVVAADGYPFIAMQTVDSLGWKGLAPDTVVQRCVTKAEPGAIYVLHVGSQSTDYAALASIIDQLTAAGYTIGGIPAVTN